MSKRPADEEPQDASTARRQKRDSPDTSPPITLKALISNREAASLIGKEGSTIAAIRTNTTARVSVSEHVKGAIERVVSISGTPGVIADGYRQLVEVLQPAIATSDRATVATTATATAATEETKPAVEESASQTPAKAAPKKKGGRKSAATKAAEAEAAALAAEEQAKSEAEAAAAACPEAEATVIKDESVPVDDTVKPFSLRLVIPHAHLGAIIGKQGARIREIMSVTGAHIQASEFNLPLSSERCVVVRGSTEAIRLAIQQITETMQVGLASSHVAMTVAYRPVTLGGIYGHPESFRRIEANDTMMTPSNPYGIPPSTFAAPPQADAQAGTAATAGAGKNVSKSKEKVTQQIYIPNDMVGAIIGKQGSKINEIRNLSGSHVKVNEPDPARVTERLITIEGTAEQNQLALYMLYQRLESEKRRG